MTDNQLTDECDKETIERALQRKSVGAAVKAILYARHRSREDPAFKATFLAILQEKQLREFAEMFPSQAQK